MLEVSELHAYYGKSHVLHGVGFTVGDGEIVSLLGRNGVGRSTTVKAIMGQVHAPPGSVKFKGRRDPRAAGLRDRAPRHRLRPRGPRHLPRPHRASEPGAGDEGAQGERTLAGGRHVRPLPRRSRRAPTRAAGVLSGGEQQMLTLCRTLIGDPDLIMIDEPTEGLAPKIVEQVGALPLRHQAARHLRAAGRAEAGHRARHLASACTSSATATSCSKGRRRTCAPTRRCARSGWKYRRGLRSNPSPSQASLALARRVRCRCPTGFGQRDAGTFRVSCCRIRSPRGVGFAAQDAAHQHRHHRVQVLPRREPELFQPPSGQHQLPHPARRQALEASYRSCSISAARAASLSS